MNASILTRASRELYPFCPKEFNSSSGRMSYIDHGPIHGRPLLLLHGNPTWSFLWRNVILRLAAEGYRVIAPDHVGMGLSERPNRFLRLVDRIADVEALLAHIGIYEFDLGVHDWGGAIGFGVAGRNCDRVGKILVTNCAAFFIKRIPLRIALCRLPVVGRFIVQNLNGFALPATWMSVENTLSRAVKEGFLAPYSHSSLRSAIADFVADIPMEVNHPTRHVLANVEASLNSLVDKPMLICWGMKDFCFNHAFLENFSIRFPKAEKIKFPNAGHFVLEDAGEEALKPISKFFAS